MTRILSLAFVFIGVQAHGSYIQNYCSDAENTIRWASGHSENSLVITERVFCHSGPRDTKVELELDRVSVELQEEGLVVLEKKRETQCHDNAEYGYATWSEVKTGRLVLTKRDGTLFSPNTRGVSEDFRSVTVWVICQDSGNSQVICPRDER